MRSFVLDASAVVHYLQAGLGAGKLEQLLAAASNCCCVCRC